MPERSVDPARLSGEALRRWYLRSPDEIAAEKQAAEKQRYQEFFSPAKPNVDRTAGVALRAAPPASGRGDEVLWVANGRGSYRAVRPVASDFLATLDPRQDATYPEHLPHNTAALEDGEFLNVGSRENAILKKLWIEKSGPWPKTADGRDYEVSHKRAIADGGKNTLDNIEPIHPDHHRPMHVREGDSARWAKRASIAKAFGGRVERSHGGPAVRGLGLAGTLLGIPHMLMNPPRTNSFENFTTDLLGLPSMDEYRRDWDPQWRPANCPPGQMCV
jgi:hypothetical protein